GLQMVSGHPRNSNTVAAGHVISTDPSARSQVGRGGRVTIIASLGPVLVKMPQVTGMSLAQAKQAVRAAGLKASAVYQTSDSIPANVVISTTPVASRPGRVDKPVQLVVSQGPPLPSFANQQLSDVQAWAAAAGISINPVDDNTSALPPGTVTGQQPAAGTP